MADKIEDRLTYAARMSAAPKDICQLMDDAAQEIERLRNVNSAVGQSQTAFEEWMVSSNYPEIAEVALAKLANGDYKSQITYAGWQGWQAGERRAWLSVGGVDRLRHL